MYQTIWGKTLLLWMYSLVKLPLVFWLKPRIVALTKTRGEILMRFRRRTKNHVNSMYFGVLCVGAELSAGILVMQYFQQQKEKYTFVFKDFSANFLKRCEGDVRFVCAEGLVIEQTIAEAKQSGQRQNVLLNVNGLIGDEVVATFTVTLSLKKR